MKCFLLRGLALFLFLWSLMPAQAQTATDTNEGVRVTADAATGAQVLTWWGKAGRTYFVQQSYDLIHWTYVPVVRDGGAAVDGLNFASTDNRQFWRLEYTDVSTGGLSGAAADFDDDGLTNQQEVEGGTGVFNADTDGDGFSDGTEALAGTDAKAATSNPESDLNDVPLLQTAFMLSDGLPYYTASSNVLQFDANTWSVWEYSIIPGNIYNTLYFVNGGMPNLPGLPARPTAGSGLDAWGSWFYAGNSHSVSLSRIVGADNSFAGMIGSYSALNGTASKYKFVVQFPSRNVRTLKVVEQKTKQAANVASPGYFTFGKQVVTGSQVRTLTLAANATETAETILQPDEADDNFMTTAKVAKTLFITPAGDPVNGPVDAGDVPASIPDGANEFTFSNATTGVLTLTLKVHLPGVVDQSAADQAKYTFEVDAIGSSVLSWPSNTGGKPTVSGEYLTATAIFTGLPQNNSDFGAKSVRLKFDGIEVASSGFEVFYAAKAKNHHGGDPSQPNWFNYYKQNEGGSDYGYDSTLVTSESNSGVPGSTRMADNSYTGGPYITTVTNSSGRLVATGVSTIHKYYQNFFSVVEHERQHAYNESSIGDTDGDDLPDSFEIYISHTDPLNKYSAVGGGIDFSDDEIYAGGPIEEWALKAADTSQDWANPGSNSKP